MIVIVIGRMHERTTINDEVPTTRVDSTSGKPWATIDKYLPPIGKSIHVANVCYSSPLESALVAYVTSSPTYHNTCTLDDTRAATSNVISVAT